MRNRTKKEQKLIDEVAGLVLLVSVLLGWFLTNSLVGTVAGFFIGLVALITLMTWKSTRFRKRMQQSGISEIDQMTGRQFEEYVGTLFNRQGYKVSYTATTGDYGADLIIKKGEETIAVQAKRYKNAVGIKAVQEVISSVKMYNATSAWVISNSTYTKQAMTLAQKNHVRMIDRNELVHMILDMQKAA